jgi:soluble lytic murein transglycosylase
LQSSRTVQLHPCLAILRCISIQSPPISHLYRILFFSVVLLLITPSDVQALITPDIEQQGSEHPQQYQQQRVLYKKAINALTRHNMTLAATLSSQLKSYPLYPYLIYKRHRLQLDRLDASTLKQFSIDFPDSPLPNRLLRAWLGHLGKHKQWQLLLDNYQPQVANTSLQCLQLWALQQTGSRQETSNQVARLWTQGNSQPIACDPLFAGWLKSTAFTEQHAWERFWLALDKNNPSLAKYSSTFLNQPRWQKTAKQALQLHLKPEQLALINIDPDIAGYQQLLHNSLSRLGRHDPALALLQLQRFNATLVLDPQERQQLQRYLGLRLLRNYPESLEALSNQINPNQSDTILLEWQLRNLLLRKEWQTIDALIEKLPDPERLSSRWRYWKARSLEAQPQADAQQRATALYTTLADERSFYGFLAADNLGIEYNLNNHTTLPDKPYLRALSQSAPMLRARELLYHQQRHDARREWRQATRDFSPQQLLQAAQLAQQWGWYEQGIRSAINARKWDDLLLRFPLVYGTQISQSAQSNSIDRSWIMATARQESAFTPDARSPAGALGLMQLMPQTAKATAKKAKISYRGPQQLTVPALNIKLGSHYLGRLSRRYANHRVLASAAYNAGPSRVNRWLRQRKDLPIDLWIETIPFDETRNYVQNVLSFSLIYSEMLGLPKQLLRPQELRGEIPKT